MDMCPAMSRVSGTAHALAWKSVLPLSTRLQFSQSMSGRCAFSTPPEVLRKALPSAESEISVSFPTSCSMALELKEVG